MKLSTRTMLKIVGPQLEVDRSIGRCLRGDITASARIPVTAGPAHTHMDIWEARLAHADTVIDEPTPDQIQEAIEAQAEADAEAEMEEQERWYAETVARQITPEEAPTEAPFNWKDQLDGLNYLEDRYDSDWARIDVTFRDKLIESASRELEGPDLNAALERIEARYQCRIELEEQEQHISNYLTIEAATQMEQSESLPYKHADEESANYDLEEIEAEIKALEDLLDLELDIQEDDRRVEREQWAEQIQAAKEAQAEQDEQEAEDYYNDWVTVENGDGTTRQITGTQYDEDVAAGLLVDVKGYLMYKSEIHGTAEESDDDYVSRLEANIRRVEAERAAEHKAAVLAVANLATRWD